MATLNITIPDADETTKGIAEVATQTETDTGTDDTKIITPKKLNDSTLVQTTVPANTAKVTNATHTGEVTGATSLTVDKTAISNKTLVPAAIGDHVIVGDASDSDNLKKVDVSDFLGGGALSFPYEADTSGDTSPADGKVTWNNATQISATKLYISFTNKDGLDIKTIVQDLVVTGSPLLIQKKDDSGVFQKWDITNSTDMGDWAEVDVTLISGTAQFGNQLQIQVTASIGGGSGSGTNSLAFTYSTTTGASLADSTTYRLIIQTNLTTGLNANPRQYLPAGTITAVYISTYNGGTFGTSETATLKFLSNNGGTSDTVTTNVLWDARHSFMPITGLSITIVAGATLIEIDTPTYATNPSSAEIIVNVILEPS